MNTINFTEQKRDQLREAYDKAVAAKLDVFEFESNEVLTQYAKYMLEYLDSVMPRGRNHGTS